MKRRGRGVEAQGAPGAALAGLLAEGVAAHRAGDLERAEAVYARILAQAPRHPDALHLAGLVAHQGGRAARARRLLEAAARERPDQPAFLNSLGVCLLEAGEIEAAAERFAAALALEPNYAEAHNNLGNALQRRGRFAEAVAAYDAALAARPDWAAAWRSRGRALHQAGDVEGGIDSQRRAVGLAPEDRAAWRYLGDGLAELGRRDEAEAAYARALELDPACSETLAARAALLERTGRLDQAVDAARAALAVDSGDVRAALAGARSLRRRGEGEAALAMLRGCAVRAGEGPEARALLRFEEGRIEDERGRAAEAWAAFAAGAALMAEARPTTAEERAFFPDLIARLAERFTPEWVRGWTPAPPEDRPSPIFLIGFPRSGTTLLEQILGSHSGLAAMEEKDPLDVVRRRLSARPEGYPDALADLAAPDIAALRELYWSEAARHVEPGPGRRLLDKMPLNTIDAGLIARLFPSAPLLLALRHPCDVVLSNVMQAFKPNAAMIHLTSLEGAARLYAATMALWRRYEAALPLRSVVTRYEDMVADPEREVRRIVAGLGLPWEDGLLAYRERVTARAIATPSYHQVAQPIHRRAVGRWRAYDAQLAPVAPLLAPWIEAFGYARAAAAQAPLGADRSGGEGADRGEAG